MSDVGMVFSAITKKDKELMKRMKEEDEKDKDCRDNPSKKKL